MKKIICCIHDKKADVFEAFMIHNNTKDAIRSFEMACQQNETFKKWPEDYNLMQIGNIIYENGEIDNNNEITKFGKIIDVFANTMILAEASDFRQTNENTK